VQLEPFEGEVVTVEPNDTEVLSQWWMLSISDGLSCPGSFAAKHGMVINGQNCFADETFNLTTGATARELTCPGITSSALTPQVASLVFSSSP
jgi:hypothetical protein